MFRDATFQPPVPLNASLTDDSAKPQALRYLQVLSLSHDPGRTHVAVKTTYPLSQTQAGTPATSSGVGESISEPATVVAIPSGAQSEELLQLMVSKLGPLWSQRQVLQVNNGQGFEVGDFRVRAGEVKQGQGPGGAQQARGVIAEITWLAEKDEDWVIVESVIRAFWEGLDINGAREYIRVAGVEESFSTIRQWCEGLRLRG